MISREVFSNSASPQGNHVQKEAGATHAVLFLKSLGLLPTTFQRDFDRHGVAGKGALWHVSLNVVLALLFKATVCSFCFRIS